MGWHKGRACVRSSCSGRRAIRRPAGVQGDKHPWFSRLNRCMADVPPFLGLCDAFRDAPWVAVGRPTHPEPCCSCMPSLSDSDGMPNTPPRNSPPAAHHQLTTVRQLMIKPHDKGE
jgi:hypothetical protein